MLERRVVDLGLEDHVEFDDRFLSVEELADLLAATDVFVTPYANREQSSSGALTFALAAGCAIVSTPYRYAEDMLASAQERRPVRRPGRARGGGPRFIEHPEELDAARAEARRVGTRSRVAVGRRGNGGGARGGGDRGAAAHADSRCRARARRRAHGPSADPGRRLRHRPARARRPSPTAPRATASTTSRGSPSSRSSSSAAPVIRSGRRSSTARSRSSTTRPTPTARMRNFMGYDRRWLDEPHLGDHVGRRSGRSARSCPPRGCPPSSARRGDCSPRSCARSAASSRCAPLPTPILGLARLDADRLDARHGSCSSAASTQLEAAYEANADAEWRWFEDALTYDNARLPHALIVGGTALGREDARAGLESFAGSATNAGSRKRRLRLTGNHGRRRGEPAPGRATSSRSTPRRSSRRSSRRSPSPAIPSTARARSSRSTGSSAATGSPAAVRLRDGRLQRRPRRARRERKRGRGVDARIPPRAARTRRRRPAAVLRRRSGRGGMTAVGASSSYGTRQPDPHGGRLAVAGQRRLQPRRRRSTEKRFCSLGSRP